MVRDLEEREAHIKKKKQRAFLYIFFVLFCAREFSPTFLMQENIKRVESIERRSVTLTQKIQRSSQVLIVIVIQQYKTTILGLERKNEKLFAILCNTRAFHKDILHSSSTVLPSGAKTVLVIYFIY